MRKILFLLVCCLCLIGCDNKTDDIGVEDSEKQSIKRMCCLDAGGEIVDSKTNECGSFLTDDGENDYVQCLFEENVVE